MEKIYTSNVKTKLVVAKAESIEEAVNKALVEIDSSYIDMKVLSVGTEYAVMIVYQ